MTLNEKTSIFPSYCPKIILLFQLYSADTGALCPDKIFKSVSILLEYSTQEFSWFKKGMKNEYKINFPVLLSTQKTCSHSITSLTNYLFLEPVQCISTSHQSSVSQRPIHHPTPRICTFVFSRCFLCLEGTKLRPRSTATAYASVILLSVNLHILVKLNAGTNPSVPPEATSSSSNPSELWAP